MYRQSGAMSAGAAVALGLIGASSLILFTVLAQNLGPQTTVARPQIIGASAPTPNKTASSAGPSARRQRLVASTWLGQAWSSTSAVPFGRAGGPVIAALRPLPGPLPDIGTVNRSSGGERPSPGDIGGPPPQPLPPADSLLPPPPIVAALAVATNHCGRSRGHRIHLPQGRGRAVRPYRGKGHVLHPCKSQGHGTPPLGREAGRSPSKEHRAGHSNGPPRDRKGTKKVHVHHGDGVNPHSTHGRRTANADRGKPHHKVKHPSPRAKEHEKSHKNHGHRHKDGGGGADGSKKGHGHDHKAQAADSVPATQGTKPSRDRHASRLQAAGKKPSVAPASDQAQPEQLTDDDASSEDSL